MVRSFLYELDKLESFSSVSGVMVEMFNTSSLPFLFIPGLAQYFSRCMKILFQLRRRDR